MNLYADEGGSGADLLVLLHGLGATGAVWAPLLDVMGPRWRGRWFAPDLPGHGSSPRALRYSVEDAALAVGDAVIGRADLDGRIVVLGHSFGAAIALALASGRFGIQPNVVLGVSAKLQWHDEELIRMRALAAQPTKRFANEADAWQRYLEVSGLHELVAPASHATARGVVRAGDTWQLAMDPAANDAGRPALGALMADARCPVHLARGGRDRLATLEAAAETLWSWVEQIALRLQ